MPNSMCSGRVMLGVLLALGRSILTECVKSGVVMMKITSRTSITSTSGTTLISAIGPCWRRGSKLPMAMASPLRGRALFQLHCGTQRASRAGRTAGFVAHGEHGVQVMGKGVQFGQPDAVAAVERVVGQHGGNGDGQPDGGHDKRLADRARYFVERALAREADVDQRVVDPPDGAEQSDVGGGGAGGGHDGEAALDAHRFLVDAVAQQAGEEFAQSACGGEFLQAVLVVVVGGFEGFAREFGKGVVDRLPAQCGAQVLQRVGRPELFEEGFGAASCEVIGQCLGDDQVPARYRERKQQEQHDAPERVGLREEVGKAQAVFHDQRPSRVKLNGCVATERTAWPSRCAGWQRQVLTAASAAASRRWEPLLASTPARTTCPVSSSSTRNTTLPVSPNRRASGG